MSYILDALKKSEQERGQGNIPNVQTVHSSSLNYVNAKNTYWPYILIAAVLLNLLAIAYFIFDKEKSLSTSLKTAGASLDTQEPSPSIKGAIEIIVEEKHSETNKVADVKEIVSQNISNAEPSSTSTDTIDQPEKVKKIQPQKIIKKSFQQTTESEITDYYDLPDSIAAKLPAIIISAHVYSTNPLQRSIVINNNFLEEGEYINNELILHEITRDGAIFNYKGDLINYGVVSEWQ